MTVERRSIGWINQVAGECRGASTEETRLGLSPGTESSLASVSVGTGSLYLSLRQKGTNNRTEHDFREFLRHVYDACCRPVGLNIPESMS